MTQASEHSVVMKCRRVAFGAGKGCLREGTLFTDFDDMAVISHKNDSKSPFFAIDAFLPFFRLFGFRKTE